MFKKKGMLNMNEDKSGTKGTEGGNKQSPSFQCKNWIGTWNNYPEDAMSKLVQFIVPLCTNYIFGKEVGKECGTPHIQMAFMLKKKLRQGTIYRMLEAEFFLDKMKGKWKDQKYCKKEGDFITSDEVIHVEEPAQELKFIIDAMDSYEFPKGDRFIHCVVDYQGGLGKTEFCRYICVKYGEDVILTGGKASDMKNQIIQYKDLYKKCPKYVFVDIPRSNHKFISWAGIEEIKNMLFYSGKYEGGMVIGNKPFICLMMNQEPDLELLSKDRWKIKVFGEKPKLESFQDMFE